MAEGTNQDLIPADHHEEEKVISKKRKRALAKKKAIEEKYHAPTKQLKLAGRGITSLDHFPTLLQLDELDLSDNALENSLEALIESTPKISILDLTGNKFSEIKSLKPLANLENLKNLSVFDCPFTTNENYRTEIYELLPNLIILDGFDKNEKELKNNESNKTEIQQPTNSNSQEEKKPESSSEDEGGEGKIYKEFLRDRAASDDESKDDDFNPSNEVSNNTENTSESTSEKDYDEDTSSQLSDSGQESQNSRSEDEQETDEPSAKRKRTDSNGD
ncbi:Acidic leucine-rich nuclear phosphoprotein 32 family member E isoform X3 [Oopsacas minuta]|uniref:Acidic leucine-rich nuclear phosphoprotein 32 family member E isoform X3 n=1 Tax=Oopsacas minuta TaxID=111878 RepID=A0AAV7JMD4_9METZ|nr:Acidic leucine-rich nuclear phosphoprotein 32 family member E isoform X3 [Oopsacas minuta]